MTINASSLKEGTPILVRGKVTFSRVASLIDGDELQRSIANERKFSSYPTKVPHTRIALVDPQIIPSNPSGELNNEELYVQERFYTVKKGDNAGHTAHTTVDKSRSIPIVLAPQANENGQMVHKQTILTADFAAGMDVTLILQVFKPKDQVNRGVGLQQIVCNEPIKYYNPAGISDDVLTALHITVDGPIQRVDPSQAPVVTASPTDEFDEIPEGSTITPDGYVMPGPGGDVATTPATPAVTPEVPVQEQPAQPSQTANADQIAALQQQLAALKAQQQVQQTSNPTGDNGSPFGAMQPGIGF